MYLEALGRPIIVINDINMAKDLLEKRSGLYSSRYAATLCPILMLTFYSYKTHYGDD